MRRQARWLLALVPCVLVSVAVSPVAQASVRLPAPPPLAAAESLLVESDNDTTVYGHLADREVAIASTTKMMTAYVTLQREPLTKRLVEQPYAAGYGESLAGLVPGARYSVKDMLEAMLLPSGNDAAHSLAVDVGGSVSHFVAEMNVAARRLGLGYTHYATPVGLDTPGNYSTARDLAKLAAVLMAEPSFARIVRESVAYLPGGLVVRNRDDLIGSYPFVVGVKTGHTADAGWCLVGAARRQGVHLISVVLDDPTEDASFDDTLSLLRYGLELFHRVHVAVGGRTYAEVPVDGTGGQETLVAANSASVVIEHGAEFNVSLSGVPPALAGPVPPGTQEGQMDVTVGGRQVLSVPLVTAAAVAPA
jgi:D-alanyl-D-alanine carboxypeptidase (penicillin-binding protein 5/6)